MAHTDSDEQHHSAENRLQLQQQKQEQEHQNDDQTSHTGKDELDPEEPDLSDQERQVGVPQHYEPPYSILTDNEKYFMVFLVSISGIWSTLSSSIYFPALPILSQQFDVSPSITNLSVVAYLLFQGIAPSFIAPLADTFGRRPMIIACTFSYCGVCVGISRVRVYWGLAVLRCVQAAVIAPVIAVSSGIVSDLILRSDRGRFLGMITGFQLLGQGFGALVGAALVTGFGWRGIFVALAIGSGFAGICNLLLIPETNRGLVGNQSIPPTRIINTTPILSLPRYRARLTNDLSSKRDPTPIDLLESYRIFFSQQVFFTLLPAGLQFSSWTMSLTTLSTSLEANYGFSVIHIGLCYLAPGLGTLLGSVASGRVLDYIYRRKKAKYDEVNKDIPKEDRPPFDIFTTRVQFTVYPTILAIIFFLIFGWTIQKKVNLSIVLISAFINSCCVVSYLTAMTTLLVDLFPSNGSAATGALNLQRCLLAAAGVGVLQSMVNRIGEGGTYTIMAGLCFISYLGLLYMIKYQFSNAVNKTN
ncbi:multidrug resistance transporter [Scheffersomyces amazonensis]|uniref:multidrug resistance transporter n=1 Tax=Scheffersomyces amazonensis TaxID=1078765 RepID=UPI00315D3BD3